MNAQILTLALMLTALTVTPTSEAATVNGCVNTEDDKGFGGTTVSCRLDCPNGAVLTVSALAHDGDATISAEFECGGAWASCAMRAPACAATSRGLTNSTQADALCIAESHEFWSSAVTVECTAASPTAGQDEVVTKVCRFIPVDDLPICGPPQGPPGGPQDACREQLETQPNVPEQVHALLASSRLASSDYGSQVILASDGAGEAWTVTLFKSDGVLSCQVATLTDSA